MGWDGELIPDLNKQSSSDEASDLISFITLSRSATGDVRLHPNTVKGEGFEQTARTGECNKLGS